MCGVRIAKYNLSGNGMKKKKNFHRGILKFDIFEHAIESNGMGSNTSRPSAHICSTPF